MNQIIATILNEMIRYFNGDVKRINHACKVYCFASLIATQSGLNEQEKRVTGIGALLHDIGILEAERRYKSSGAKFQETEGPPVAREILGSVTLDTHTIDRICFIIGNHHSYEMIDGIDFQILIEADLLVNTYEDSLPVESIRNMRETIFKTEPGIRLLDTIYPEINSLQE